MQSSLWLNSLSEKEKDNSDSEGQQPLHAPFNLDAAETLITHSVCDKNCGVTAVNAQRAMICRFVIEASDAPAANVPPPSTLIPQNDQKTDKL